MHAAAALEGDLHRLDRRAVLRRAVSRRVHLRLVRAGLVDPLPDAPRQLLRRGVLRNGHHLEAPRGGGGSFRRLPPRSLCVVSALARASGRARGAWYSATTRPRSRLLSGRNTTRGARCTTTRSHTTTTDRRWSSPERARRFARRARTTPATCRVPTAASRIG